MTTHTIGWFLHPTHGYMLRGPDYGDGYQTVVTALMLEVRDLQDDPKKWEAHKSRLRVNAGCGAIAADSMQVGDHNPAFVPVKATKVPAHIRQEFDSYL